MENEKNTNNNLTQTDQPVQQIPDNQLNQEQSTSVTIPQIEQNVEKTENVKTINENHIFSNIDLSEEEKTNTFNIKVIGVGGAGCNVINHIAAKHPAIVNAAKIYAFNTDLCSLKLMKNVANIFLLDKEELKGYGSGGNPEIGRKAVQHDSAIIKTELQNTDILFIIAGMGKGAGSGGAPELAQIAKELGILTVCIVNMPSVACEGSAVYNNAFNSLQTLMVYSDSLSTISNEKIIGNNKDISFYDAYQLANEEIANIIEDIINIIFTPSTMNIDFADLKTFFKENKFFMSNRLSLDANALSQFKIKESIASKIKNSFSDVNINDCKRVVANINLSKNAPTTILVDINKSFAEITHNDMISLVAGINYNDENKVELSFLIAGKNYSTDFKNVFDGETVQNDGWSSPTVKVEVVNESESKEYDNLMKDVDEVTKSTEDILNKTNDDLNQDIG